MQDFMKNKVQDESKKKKQTRLIGMNLKRMNINLTTINRIIGSYKSLNQAAETALLNWYQVREYEIRRIIEELTFSDRMYTLKKMQVHIPARCTIPIFRAIVEARDENLSERLDELSDSAILVLIDITIRGHFDDIITEEEQREKNARREAKRNKSNAKRKRR